RVPLARRVRHDLHPGVEDLLAGHAELGLAAAEQRREQRRQVAVDGVESLAQQLAAFAVDLADRLLHGAYRLFQVGGLRVEEGLALLAGAELLERGQVDRAELVDRRREPRRSPAAPRWRRPRQAARRTGHG